MIHNATLGNHIRVVGEEVLNVRSVSVGIYIKNGSVDENVTNNGISHFIEHMFFKGTYKRTAKKLADDMSRIGGHVNAYTSKEYVCFYAHVLDEHLDTVIDILSDMLTHSKFDQEDIQKEKGIILEEYAMYEDNPEEVVIDELHAIVWPEQSLGYNIIGTKENINRMEKNMLEDYVEKQYVGDNIVISVVGKINFSNVLSKLEKAFSPVKSGNSLVRDQSTIYVPSKRGLNRSIEQSHMAISFPSINYFSDDTYGLNMVSVLLGGGLNSRLFQSIREEQGLAYSLYSFIENFHNAGLFTTYAATSVAQTERLYEAIYKEIQKFKKEGITNQELIEVKEQIKSNLIIGMENMSTRMSHYGKGELLLGRIRHQDDMINRINEVDKEKVEQLILETFDFNKVSLTLVSPKADLIDQLVNYS